ncbi:MAG: gamma-glutamyl-gamma-aminobutyrate hydrolase family protein, partial [Candidatus Cloacimonadota bacterium]|nr:gamma-glutamyl-gamma-aminobutyrate hydrolase family protein [Candidatus Cloacimonadota bacterium]
MILIFNANLSKKSVKNFDVKIAPFITKNRKYETIYIDDKKGILFSKSPNLMKKYTHLLITGSALSASQGSEYDQIFINIINYFVNNNKAVLGICYGHQMIARAILGDSACRRTKIPEFSWRQINIIENHLFEGILNPVIIESHYDEVCNLTDDFEVIASNEDCEIQAFQYKQKPVWGLQFH